MKRPDGIEIEVGERIDQLDDQWWCFECDYYLPGSSEPLQGSIQGDGELFALDTLEDDGGDLVKIAQP